MQTLRSIALTSAWIFITSAFSWAAAAETVSPSKADSYRVGPGDILHVRVFGEAEFSGDFRVGADGMIDYPFLRKIAVERKTTDEMAGLISERLKDGYLSDPQVTVEVKDFQSQKVTVLGAVRSPGIYVLKEETKILELISRAGGIDAGGAKRILLVRPGTRAADEPAAAPAQSGGESGAEQGAEAGRGERAAAGGEETAEAGAREGEASLADRAQVAFRAVDPVVIDFHRLVEKGDFSQNLSLKGGDILNVPKVNEIYVLGHVGKPGPIVHEENMTVVQAVIMAGGPLPTASPKSTYILRRGEKKGEKIAVRLDRILESKAKNVVLKADDVIVVPESFF